VAKAGIARTFQNIRLFGEMTALENVMVGRHVRTKQAVFGAVFRHKAAREEEAAIRAKRSSCWTSWASASSPSGAPPVLRRPAPPGNRPRAGDRSATAGAGRTGRRHERHRETGPARAAGEDPGEGKTILLIEHDVKLMMGLCDRMTVLDYGKPIAEGCRPKCRRTRR
jgi:branched-chain amino acid transport system ATP-binding protein